MPFKLGAKGKPVEKCGNCGFPILMQLSAVKYQLGTDFMSGNGGKGKLR